MLVRYGGSHESDDGREISWLFSISRMFAHGTAAGRSEDEGDGRPRIAGVLNETQKSSSLSQPQATQFPSQEPAPRLSSRANARDVGIHQSEWWSYRSPANYPQPHARTLPRG